MKTFSLLQTIPVTWLACLLVTLSATNVGAQGQTPPNSVPPGIPANFFTNPYTNPRNPIQYPPNFVPPTPPPPRRVDVQRAQEVLRERIAQFKKLDRRGDVKKGDYKATYNLGVVYAFGAGVPLNFKIAFRHFKKSAEEAVYAPAMFNLAICYATGTGAQIDRIQAYKWWSLAAAQGHPLAAQARDNIGKIVKKSGIEAAQRMSSGYERILETRIKREELWDKAQKLNQPDTANSPSAKADNPHDAAYRLSHQLYLNRNNTGSLRNR